MQISRLSILVLFVVLILASVQTAIAQEECEHFDWVITDANMSIIIQAATLDGESLVHLDEIGLFTEDGVCAGGVCIPDNFPDDAVGPAAWGAEQNENNGFSDEEPIEFRVWDHEAEMEAIAEVTEANGDVIYTANGFIVISIAAESGPAEPNIVVDERDHDFGLLRVGQSSDWVLVVGNNGRENLTIDQMQFAGDYFSVNFEGEVVLEASTQQEFTVTYAPEAQGEHNATLTIYSDDPDEENVEIQVTGAAEPALPPTVVLSTENLAFGDVLLGSSRNRIVTITNDGDETLTIDDVALEGEIFMVDFQGDIDIPSMESADLVVTFEPADLEVYTDDMVIHSNDPNNESVSVHLSGRGVDEEEPPIINVNELDNEHFFGYVPVGEMSTWRFAILNDGVADLIVTDVQIDNETFSTDFNDRMRIRAEDDHWYVEVTFAPEEVAFFDAVLTITCNDPERQEEPFQIMLGGVGGEDQGRHFQWHITNVNHSILVVETTLDGEAVPVGTEIGLFTSRDFLAGGGIVTEDEQAGVTAFGDEPETDIIDGFEEDEAFRIMVWDPEAEVEAWGAISQNVNGGPEGYLTNAFTVLRIAAETGDPEPRIYVRRMSHYFGQVRYEDNNSSDWTFTIQNRGGTALEVTSIESDFDEFTTDFPQEGATVDMGSQMDVIVTFDPTEARSYEGRLTINSNDMLHRELYIDISGDGVVEAHNPAIGIAENYFFGNAHLDNEVEWTLVITSTGEAPLNIESITMEGDEAFASNWADQPRLIQPNETFELMISFMPNEEREYNAEFSLFTNIDEEPVMFPVRGYGEISDDHFLERNTGAAHTIRVLSAMINTPQNNSLSLYPGDEIAAFTPLGLCAGHGVVEEAGEELSFSVFANDQNSDFTDGFVAGEEFMFKFWDSSTDDELECSVQFVEGPEVYQLNGETQLNLGADAVSEEPLIYAEPMNEEFGVPIYDFGPVRLGEPVDGMFTIRNIGGANLVITGVQSNMRVFTHDFADQIVVAPDESVELMVTFTPAARNAYQGTITVSSNDPHMEGYRLHPVGIGSESNGHFVSPLTDRNHSLLFNNISVGGGAPGINSEIGVFTTAGVCAGALVVAEPNRPVGGPAWGDDSDTDYLVEGFVDGEALNFIYYDFGTDTEYEPQVEFLEGPEVWTDNGFTVINLTIEEIPRIVPVVPITVDERQAVAFNLVLENVEGDFEFTWTNADEYENIPDGVFTVENNVGGFAWQTDDFDSGRYVLRFTATQDDFTLRATVTVIVVDINREPMLVEEVRAQIFGDDPDNNVYSMNEDAGWVDVVDLDVLFMDPDNDQMLFYIDDEFRQLEGVEHRINGAHMYQVRPNDEWSGSIENILLIANDGQDDNDQVAAASQGRRIRSVSMAQQPAPHRDNITQFVYDLNVLAVNDDPYLDRVEPDPNGEPFEVLEGEELVILFYAADVDNEDDELTITMFDRDDLPQDAEFVGENNLGTFTWTPDFDMAREELYTPRCRIQDSEDPAGEMEFVIEILVIDVNRMPDEDIEPADGNEYDINEGEELVIVLRATDPDGDETLTWTISDLDDLPREAVVSETEDGVASFTWTPTFDHARDNDPYTPTLRVTDDSPNGENFLETTISITVNNVNRPVILRANIENAGIDEDAERTDIVDLLAYYDDEDLRDPFFQQHLVYTITVDPAELQLDIANDMLSSEPIDNFNTEVQGVVAVTVTATDNIIANPVEGSFSVSVNSINDPPADFNQLMPENDHVIVYADSNNTIEVSWDEAVQNEWETDEVSYVIVFKLHPASEDSVVTPEFAEFTQQVENPLQIVEDLGLVLEEATWVYWYVWAMDDTEVPLRSANDPFRFQMPALSVWQDFWDAGIPENYFMDQSYPNPFNSETTVRFGLPRAGEVTLTVWDMHGRKVGVLGNEMMSAGRYSVVWDANGMTSGIYLIRLQAGDFTAMKKAILVR